MSNSKESIGKVRWYIATMMFMATTSYYFDRNIFQVAINNPDYAKVLHFIKPDGSIDNVLFAAIDSAHKMAYAVGFLLMGRFVDWVGTKRGFAVGVGMWSLVTIGCAFLNSFWPLFIGMLFMGFFHATNHPACVKTVSVWFPVRERSVAVAFYNSGTNFGAMIVPLLVPWICLSLNWQMAYVLPGIAGLVWVALWWFSFDNPESSKFVGDAEREHITQGQVVVSSQKLSWGQLFTNRTAWGLAIAKFLIDPVWFLYLSWLPMIFKVKYGIDFKKLFVPIMLIYAVSLVGNFAGGNLSAYCVKRGWTINRSRKLVMLLFAILALPSFVAGITSNMWVVVAIVGLGTFAHQAYSTLLFTTVTDVFPKSVVASVTGFGSLFGAVGGIIISFSAGFIANKFGYAPLFCLGSFAYLLGLLIMHLMNPRMEPVKI